MVICLYSKSSGCLTVLIWGTYLSRDSFMHLRAVQLITEHYLPNSLPSQVPLHWDMLFNNSFALSLFCNPYLLAISVSHIYLLPMRKKREVVSTLL